MSNFVKLPFRGYSTLTETAELLSQAFEKSVEEADVLTLCLQGILEPHFKVGENVMVCALKSLDSEDVPVFISKPGYKFFHHNPSWEPLDDIAKAINAKVSLKAIEVDYPELFAAIREGKYKTRKAWTYRVGKNERLIPDGEFGRLLPVPTRISKHGDGWNWIRKKWRFLSGEESRSGALEPTDLTIIFETQEGGLVMPAQRQTSTSNSFLGRTKALEWCTPDESDWVSKKIPGESVEIVFSNNAMEKVIGDFAQVEVEKEDDCTRVLEAFGVLIERYALHHGPDYRHGDKPKASRIVENMLDVIPDGVTGMGDRKLKDHVGAAIKAWEAKKHR